MSGYSSNVSPASTDSIDSFVDVSGYMDLHNKVYDHNHLGLVCILTTA
jgi:hypothetical protein